MGTKQRLLFQLCHSTLEKHVLNSRYIT